MRFPIFRLVIIWHRNDSDIKSFNVISPVFRGYSRDLMYICIQKELFDSIVTQNAEIRTVSKSLPLFLKYSAKSLFFNRLSQTDKNLK